MPEETSDKHARPSQDDRCCFLHPSGRRCAEFRVPGHDSLCLYHVRREHEREPHSTPEARAIVAQVLGTREQFKTATQVNDGLAKLFALRSRKLISHRDAHLLTYMCQLLLFSLHKVENDFTRTYELKEWEKVVDRALRAHTSNLPPLSQTNPAPKIIFEIPPTASAAVGVDVGAASLRSKGAGVDVEGAGLVVGAPSFPSGKSGEVEVDVAGVPVDVDSPRPSKSRRRKKKRAQRPPRLRERRPAPKTGREFAIQVFDDLLEDRAARKQRTVRRFGEEDRSGEEMDRLGKSEQQPEQEADREQEQNEDQEYPPVEVIVDI
jgi:hypothetical protein